jgi:hypothetical protein
MRRRMDGRNSCHVEGSFEAFEARIRGEEREANERVLSVGAGLRIRLGSCGQQANRRERSHRDEADGGGNGQR